ncbi:unnamed protein product [Cunninghamella blakesleeana]
MTNNKKDDTQPNNNLEYDESDEDELPLTKRQLFLKRTRKEVIDKEISLDTKRRRQIQDTNCLKEQQITLSPAQTPPDL